MRAMQSHVLSRLQIGTRCGRDQRTQYATISRVSVKAVNTVVMMPMPKRDGEAAHRAGADEEQHRGGDEGGDVGVEDGRQRAGEAASIAVMAVRPARTSSRMRS